MKCSKCGADKTKHKNRSGWYCKPCRAKYDSECRMNDPDKYRSRVNAWYARNRDAVRGKKRAHGREAYRLRLAKYLIRAARARAIDRGVPFDLTDGDLVIPETCPVLGLRLTVGSGRMHSASPTIDRIDPSMGYVPGNIAVISALANRIKSNASAEQVAAVARWMQTLIPHCIASQTKDPGR